VPRAADAAIIVRDNEFDFATPVPKGGGKGELMKKGPNRRNTRWTPTQVRRLRKLATGNTPTGLIAYNLGRTPGAVQSKASEKRISLKPTNRSPYNRRRK
jgi:hypothetical protein